MSDASSPFTPPGVRNNQFLVPNADVFFNSGMGIMRNSFKWNYAKREAAKEAERERLEKLAKSEDDLKWAQLYCDYYEVLQEFDFPAGISPSDASKLIAKTVLKKSARCIDVYTKMGGRWRAVLPAYLTRLEELRKEAENTVENGDDDDMKLDSKSVKSEEIITEGSNHSSGFSASLPSQSASSQPDTLSETEVTTDVPSQCASSRSDHVSLLFNSVSRLTYEAECLRRRHATVENDVSLQHRNFRNSLVDVRSLSWDVVLPDMDSDEARRASDAKRIDSALHSMEHSTDRITTQCQEFMEISSLAISLLGTLTEKAQDLISLCAWVLNDKQPLRDSEEATEATPPDDLEPNHSSAKKRRLEAPFKVHPKNCDSGHEAVQGSPAHAVSSENLFGSVLDDSEQSSVSKQTTGRGSAVSRKQTKAKQNAEVEWDKPDADVEIILGWSKPGGSMRRLLDSQIDSLRDRGIVFLDGPTGANDADEAARALWFREHKDEFEAAIVPVVKAYKDNVISSLFCSYCRNRQREGNNASSAIRDHWKNYHARTAKKKPMN